MLLTQMEVQPVAKRTPPPGWEAECGNCHGARNSAY
jgi:hypothetical protein